MKRLIATGSAIVALVFITAGSAFAIDPHAGGATGQPSQSCQAEQASYRANAASAPGSAFNRQKTPAPTTPEPSHMNSNNPKSVNNTSVACFQISPVLRARPSREKGPRAACCALRPPCSRRAATLASAGRSRVDVLVITQALRNAIVPEELKTAMGSKNRSTLEGGHARAIEGGRRCDPARITPVGVEEGPHLVGAVQTTDTVEAVPGVPAGVDKHQGLSRLTWVRAHPTNTFLWRSPLP